MPSAAITDPAREEPERHVSGTVPSREPLRRARWRRWLPLLLVLVALRVLLTIAVAPLAERRLSHLLGTRVEVGGVSVAPIDAVVTLRDVVVHRDGGEPALTAERVRLDLQWLPLLHRSLVLRQLTVEGGEADHERLAAAGWTVERIQRLDPATELPPGWSFALDRLVVRDTRLRLNGVAARDVTVREARVPTRRRRATAFGRLPNLRIDAHLDGGRLLVLGSTDIRDDGASITAKIRLKDVPLRPFAAHRPAALRDASAEGRVSGRLEYRRDPGRRARLTGRLRGRRIAVRVPTLAEPALSVRRVEMEVAEADLLRRRIAIDTLALHGAELAVRPGLVAPVPLLDGLARASREPRAWRWSIGHLDVASARLLTAGAGGRRVLAARVSGEAIGPAAYWSPLRAAIDWDGGTAAFDGTVRMIHGFTIAGRLTARDMDAAAVARLVDPPHAPLVQAGRLAADLDVDFAPGASDGPPFDVRGVISAAALRLEGEDPNAFAFEAARVDLMLARIVPAGHPPVIALEFDSAALTSPRLSVKRGHEPPPGPAIELPASHPEREAPAVTLAVADVSVRDGRVLAVDERAAPALSLDLAALEGGMRNLRLPAAGVTEFHLRGAESRLGAFGVTGARDGRTLRAELSAPDVALPALAPFLQRTAAPYAFTSGRGAVRAIVSIDGDRWSADTALTLRDATVGGDDGMLQRSLGTTVAAALAAVEERHGEVMLRLPLASAGAPDLRGLTEAFAGAVREALARPRRVPLPETPIEIGFAPGRIDLDPDASRRLAAIAAIVRARPDAVLELRGVVSQADRRWLAEQALAQQPIEKPRGFGAVLQAIGVRDQGRRIREALLARATGREGALSRRDEEALDAAITAAPPVPEEPLARLSAARAELVARLLAERHGVLVARIIAPDPTGPDRRAAVVDARVLPTPGITLR